MECKDEENQTTLSNPLQTEKSQKMCTPSGIEPATFRLVAQCFN